MSKTIVVLGASGNIGSKLAHTLLAQGHKVIALARHADKLADLKAAGAEVVAGDLHDQALLTSLFNRADAAFTLIPPYLSAPDYLAYADALGTSVADAIAASSLRQVVNLSSHGADRPDGRIGPIRSGTNQEVRLNAIDGLNVVHLRPTYFMENNYAHIPQLLNGGVVYGGLGAETRVPMIATQDIAAKAAEYLAGNINGQQTQLLLGDRHYTLPEAVTILGNALGVSNPGYVQVPLEAVGQSLRQFGFSESMTNLYLEFFQGIEEDGIFSNDTRTAENTTPTTYEQFAQQVVATMPQTA